MNVSEMLEFREELVNRHGEELAAVDRLVALMSVGMAVQIDRGATKSKGKPGRPPGLTMEAARREKAASSKGGAQGTARPTSAARNGGVGSERQFAGGGGKLSDAIRRCAGMLPAGFSRVQITERLPEQWQNTNTKSATAVNLLDMVARGELTRVGQGSEARYTVARLKPARGDARPPGGKPSEKEKAYRALRAEIQVPRDAEMEAS